MPDENRPRITDVKDFGPGGFKWITLRRLQYVDQEGRERVWEAAERRTRQGSVDAVAILAKVLSESAPEKIILVSQFRPPQGQFVIEFPAGLIDEGESASQSAARELKEETGYSGEVMEESPIIYSDPGLTSSNFQLVTIHINADADENKDVNPKLEEGEFVETLLLPVAGLYHKLLDIQKERNCDLDARLLLYAQGLHHAWDSSQTAGPSPNSQPPSQPSHPSSSPSQASPSQQVSASPNDAPESRDHGSTASSSAQESASDTADTAKVNADLSSQPQSAATGGTPHADASQNDAAPSSTHNVEANEPTQPSSQPEASDGQVGPSTAEAAPQAASSDGGQQQPQKQLPSADGQGKPDVAESAPQAASNEGGQKQPPSGQAQAKPPAADKSAGRNSFKPAGLRPLPARPGSKAMGAAQSKAAASGAAVSNGDAKKAALAATGQATPGASSKAAPGKAGSQANQQQADTSKAKWGIEPAPLKANGKKHVPSSDDSDFWKESSDDASGNAPWSFPKTWLVAGLGAAAGTLATLAITALVSSRRGSR